MTTFRPTGIEKIDESTLGVRWSDAVESRFPVRFLRERCPCAGCVDEMTGVRTLDPASVDDGIKPVEIKPVGQYALHIKWSDSHDTGIYAFDYLRHLHAELEQAE